MPCHVMFTHIFLEIMLTSNRNVPSGGVDAPSNLWRQRFRSLLNNVSLQRQKAHQYSIGVMIATVNVLPVDI